MDSEDKLMALESSIKFMAEYMKKEVTDFKKQVVNSEDFDRLRYDMENEIHRISLDIMEKIGALEAKIGEIKSGSMDTDKDARISRLERRMEELLSLNNRVIDVSGELSGLKSAIGSAALSAEDADVAKVHMARLEKIEDDIKDIRAAPKAPVIDSVKLKQMSERMLGLVNEIRFLKNETDEMKMHLDDISKFDNRFRLIYDDIGKLKKQVDEMPKTVSHTDREILDEIDGVKRQLESLSRIEGRLKPVYDEIGKMRNRLEEVSKTLGNTNKEIVYEVDELKAKAEDTSKFDAKFKSIYDEIGKIKGQMEEVPRTLGNADREILDEMDRIKKQLDEMPSTTGSKINMIYSELGEIRKYVEEAPGITGDRIKYIDKELNDIKKQLSSFPMDKTGRVGQIYDEINRLKKRFDEIQGASNDARYIRSEINDIKKRLAESMTMDKIKSIYDELGKVRQTADEELAYKMSMDKKIADMENRINNMAGGNEIKKSNDSVAAHEELLDEISDIRRMVDEEAAQRISLDKKLLDIESRFGTTPERKLDIDYRKISEMLKSDKSIEEAIEKKFEEGSVKLVTERINDFARLMDKRFPNLATKDEIARLEEKISTKPKAPIQSREKDVSERIAKLEASVNNMIDALNAMKYHKSSFVVE